MSGTVGTEMVETTETGTTGLPATETTVGSVTATATTTGTTGTGTRRTAAADGEKTTGLRTACPATVTGGRDTMTRLSPRLPMPSRCGAAPVGETTRQEGRTGTAAARLAAEA